MKRWPRRRTMVFLPACLLVLAAAFGAASRASADEGSPRGAFAPVAVAGGGFGVAEQIVISGDLEAHLRSGWELRLHPAADYFIATNISVGAVLGLTYDSGVPSTTTIDIGARAGYSLGIAEKVGIWFKGGIYYTHTWEHPDSHGSAAFRIDAPLLYHLAPHLFAGIGPYFALDLSGGGNGYGLDSIVGGWF